MDKRVGESEAARAIRNKLETVYGAVARGDDATVFYINWRAATDLDGGLECLILEALYHAMTHKDADVALNSLLVARAHMTEVELEKYKDALQEASNRFQEDT